MATREPSYASTLEKVADGHWRRTYKKDGLTADLHAEFHHLWMDLTDFQLVEGMRMSVAGTDPWSGEDDYAHNEIATAKGHLDNASLHFIEKVEDEPWRINTVNVTLRFERGWRDEPVKKLKRAGEGLEEMFKFVESDETWTAGESQCGQIYGNANKRFGDQDELVSFSLRVPRDFLPKVREAAAHPSRVGRIRLGVKAKIFEEGAQGAFATGWSHLDFMLEPEGHSEAYITNLSFHSAKALPTPVAAKNSEDERIDQRPLALQAADGHPPATIEPYGAAVVKALTYCAFALASIAVILLLKA